MQEVVINNKKWWVGSLWIVVYKLRYGSGGLVHLIESDVDLVDESFHR